MAARHDICIIYIWLDIYVFNVQIEWSSLCMQYIGDCRAVSVYFPMTYHAYMPKREPVGRYV